MFNQLQEYRQRLVEDLKIYRRATEPQVYLVSFPKSGATWLNLMLTSYFIRAYSLDEPRTVELTNLTHKYPQIPVMTWTHDESAVIYESGERPEPERLFNYGWRFKYLKHKIIFLVRDPRDVVVSHYHQVTKRSDSPMQFQDLGGFIRDPVLGFNRIIRFYRIWRRNSFFASRFLMVTYEDLLSQGSGTLGEILSFVEGRQPDKALVESVYSACTADSMRKEEIGSGITGMKAFSDDPNALKVRKARIGTYKEEMSQEDIEYCNRRLRRMPRVFPYS